MKRELFKGGGLLKSKLKNVEKLEQELDIPLVMKDFEQALKNV
jgi:hypothetical protein